MDRVRWDLEPPEALPAGRLERLLVELLALPTQWVLARRVDRRAVHRVELQEQRIRWALARPVDRRGVRQAALRALPIRWDLARQADRRTARRVDLLAPRTRWVSARRVDLQGLRIRWGLDRPERPIRWASAHQELRAQAAPTRWVSVSLAPGAIPARGKRSWPPNRKRLLTSQRSPSRRDSIKRAFSC